MTLMIASSLTDGVDIVHLLVVAMVLEAAVILTLLALRHVEIVFVVLCANILTTYLPAIAEHRLFIGSVPISMFDGAAVWIILVAVIRQCLRRDRGSPSSVDVLVAAPLLFILMVGTVVGMARGNAPYGIMQGIRIVSYLLGGYMAGRILVNRESQVSRFIKLMLFGNVIVVIWQLYYMYRGPVLVHAYNENLVTSWGLGRWIRGFFIELPNTGLLLVIALLVCHRTFLAPRTLRVLGSLFALGVILSFSRNQWVASAAAILAAFFIAANRRKVMRTVSVIALGLFLVAGGAAAWKWQTATTYLSNLLDTGSVALGGDRHATDRLTVTKIGWGLISADPVVLSSGLGFGAAPPELVLPEVGYFDNTDGYLWFAMSAGVPGLLALLLVVGTFLRVSVHVARHSQSRLYRAFGFAQALYVVFELVRTFVAGGFGYWTRGIYLGFVAGVVATIYVRHCQETARTPRSRVAATPAGSGMQLGTA